MGDDKQENGDLALPEAPKLSNGLIELNPARVHQINLTEVAEAEPDFRENFEGKEGDEVEGIRWVILPQGDRRPVGFAELLVSDAAAGTLEAGYWVMSSQRRNGFAEAAMRLIADWAGDHTSATEIRLEIKTSNDASRALAEKLGYEHRGVRKPPFPRPQHELRELYSLGLEKETPEREI
ncbi:MAG TPA: GNAT family N-acetyltransferase [Solirubrobacterales bacterium]|nr:GNAT family N-acetyltransferase [Solirubrobacterales bacterium]